MGVTKAKTEDRGLAPMVFVIIIVNINIIISVIIMRQIYFNSPMQNYMMCRYVLRFRTPYRSSVFDLRFSNVMMCVTKTKTEDRGLSAAKLNYRLLLQFLGLRSSV